MEPKIYFLDTDYDESYPKKAAEYIPWCIRGRKILGIHAWGILVHVQLKELGYETEMVSEAPQDGILVGHVDAMAYCSKGPSVMSISARADRDLVGISDYEVVQNKKQVRETCFFMTHMSQPGIVPRDKSRGDLFENAVYVGWPQNCNYELQRKGWEDGLKGRGLTWDLMRLPWVNFRQTDLIIALRKKLAEYHNSKPATKLYNAWLANVPAIFGPESAYRDLRESDLDYLEASTAEEALEHIDRLKKDKELRKAMIENGRKRAADFTLEAIAKKWIPFLERMKDVYRERSGQFMTYEAPKRRVKKRKG